MLFKIKYLINSIAATNKLIVAQSIHCILSCYPFFLDRVGRSTSYLFFFWLCSFWNLKTLKYSGLIENKVFACREIGIDLFLCNTNHKKYDKTDNISQNCSLLHSGTFIIICFTFAVKIVQLPFRVYFHQQKHFIWSCVVLFTENSVKTLILTLQTLSMQIT